MAPSALPKWLFGVELKVFNGLQKFIMIYIFHPFSKLLIPVWVLREHYPMTGQVDHVSHIWSAHVQLQYVLGLGGGGGSEHKTPKSFVAYLI